MTEEIKKEEYSKLEKSINQLKANAKKELDKKIKYLDYID